MNDQNDDFTPYDFQGALDGNALREFMVWCSRHNVSDIHMQGGNHLVVSRHGRLRRASKMSLADDTVSKLVDDVFTKELRPRALGAIPSDRALQLDGDVNNRYGLARGERLRLRCNLVACTAGREDRTTALTARIIPWKIPPLGDMGLEPELFNALLPPSGLGLVGGITGSGKSTLLAAIYRYCIDHFQDRKITTIEDPIEYVLGNANDLLPPTQLQIGRDVLTYADGIRAALRRAPSIIGVGEMRDLETLQAGLLAGQVGHFNLTTVHIESPGEAISRCLTLVPPEMKEAIAHSMLGVLRYIIVQTLLPTTDGKRQAVREFIVFDDGLRETLKEMPYPTWGHYIDGIIRQERRRIIDQAWRLFGEGRIDRAVLVSSMTANQLKTLETEGVL